MPTSAFKSKALPLHVNLTHTPPTLPDADSVPVAPTDPGHLGSVTLVAKSFSTGSYGWSGNKRLTIELLNAEGGEKEKVTVTLTCVLFCYCMLELDCVSRINATVIGSKEGDKDEEKDEKNEEAAEEEAAED
jgi:hypothetical protein